MQSLKAQYFAMRRIKDINWKEIVGDWQSINCDVQGQLMEVTVLNPLSRTHPPSSQYRRMFLKYIISQLESVNVEVCDELYEEYTDMMSKSLAEDELCYKTYFLGSETRNVITMEESVKLVSRGTTGLQTWPAAQHLAEWTLENKHLFEGRCILELGSGLGFTGLVVCQNSHPKQYIFTDCHQDVLDTLTKNIALNVPTFAQSLRHAASIDSVQDKHQSPRHCCRDGTMCKGFSVSPEKYYEEMSDDNFERECQPTSIRVVTLDWEKVTEGDLGDLATGVDVILAADVVYDTSIIDALVRVIRWLLLWPGKSNISHSPVMFIASTVRNTDTRDCFLMALESAAISHMEVSGPEKETFFYDRCIPIDILQLKMT